MTDAIVSVSVRSFRFVRLSIPMIDGRFADEIGKDGYYHI